MVTRLRARRTPARQNAAGPDPRSARDAGRTPPQSATAAAAEHRRSPRIAISLPVEVRWSPEHQPSVLFSAVTHDASSDGLSFEVDDASPELAPGDAIELELTIPPSAGVAVFEGRAAALAEIVRLFELPPLRAGAPPRRAAAARFVHPLKLRF